jgi:hypothetical protein
MVGQRNADIHAEGTTTHDTIEERSVVQHMSSGPNNPITAQMLMLGWLSESDSTVGVPALAFEIDGAHRPALHVCKDYLKLVEQFVRDFKVAFPSG